MVSVSRQNGTIIPKKFLTFLSILGIVPLYSFNEGRLVHKNIFRCYSLVLVLLLTCSDTGFCYALFLKFHMGLSVKTVLIVLNEVTALIEVASTILGAAFWNMNIWEELYKRYIYYNNLIKHLFVFKPTNVFVVRHAKVILFLELAFFVSFCLVSYFLVSDGKATTPYYIASLIVGYFLFLVNFIVAIATGLMKYMYSCINQFFRGFFTNDICLRSIQKVRQLYLEMDRMLQIFNRLFGWPFLFISFSFVIYMLSTLVRIVNSKGFYSGYSEHLIINIISVLHTMVSTIMFLPTLTLKMCYSYEF